MDIIVTVSPFVHDQNFAKFTHIVTKIIDAGINIFRVNFKKLDWVTCKRIDKAIEIIKDMDPNAHIILDVPYPYRKKRMVMNGYTAPYYVNDGEVIELNITNVKNLKKPSFVVDSDILPKTGERLYYSDGDGEFLVIDQLDENRVLIQAQGSFEVWNNKSIHVIGEERILQESTWIAEVNRIINKYNVKEIMVSFISTYDDVVFCQNTLQVPPNGIIPKIETAKAIQNIEQIVMECDKIMLARGDLGLDISLSQFSKACNIVSKITKRNNKTLIVGTDILSSLEKRTFPTRGDIIDLDKIINEYQAEFIVLTSKLAISPYFTYAISIIKEFYLEKITNENDVVENV